MIRATIRIGMFDGYNIQSEHVKELSETDLRVLYPAEDLHEAIQVNPHEVMKAAAEEWKNIGAPGTLQSIKVEFQYAEFHPPMIGQTVATPEVVGTE